MIYESGNILLNHLGPVSAMYSPKDIHVWALQATRENIGKLALEFESELLYGEGGLPCFRFPAKRFGDTQPDGQLPPVRLTVRLGDWIVALWGELHIYRDLDFRNTFDIMAASDGRHELTADPGTFAVSAGLVESTTVDHSEFIPRGIED
jgi:hypothetical protein